jgi:hypothetical protein
MKKISVVFLFSNLLFANSFASVLTVNNLPGNGALYAQIDPAIAAASAGDTIYVGGSSSSYSGCVISKSITIIGPGSYAQTSMLLKATISSININSNLNGIAIKGLNITSINAVAKTNISNLLVSDCVINNGISLNGLVNSSNLTFSNNLFVDHIGTSITWGGNTGCFNILITNNILAAAINSLTITGATLQNNVFYNCLVNGSAAVAFFNPCSNMIIKNNIFYNSNPTANATGCTYTNNITYSTSSTYTALGGNNMDNADPQFINVGTSGGYLPTYNFDIQSLSPANNAGSDGTDVGYYGGGFHSSPTGEPQDVPVIRAMDVNNTNVPNNGNVNVKVRSTKAR